MNELVSQVLTNALVIVGWFIVFRQALAVRYRDDLRKIVDLAADTINDIYQRCCAYYSDRSSGHINHNSTNIKAKFVLLSHYLLMLREAGIDTGVSKSLTEYKIHASGGYFETLDYQKQAEVPNWQIDLASSAQELRYRLERGYFDQSKRQRKFRLLR